MFRSTGEEERFLMEGVGGGGRFYNIRKIILTSHEVSLNDIDIPF